MRFLLPAVAVAAVLTAIAIASVLAQESWLVPSLGSAASVQILTPRDPSARSWNTLIGQLLGLVGGLAGVFSDAAGRAPSFVDHHFLSYTRVFAVAVAVLLTAILQLACKAINPAGFAVALIVATGATAADSAGMRNLAVGIVLVTLLGETIRHAVLRFDA